MRYSASAPPTAGQYTFKSEAYGFDASGSKHAAFNATKQVVKGKASLEGVLEFFGFVTE